MHVVDRESAKGRGTCRPSVPAKVFTAPRVPCCSIMVHSMERHGADGCSVAAQPPPSPPKCEAAVVGMAQCEREPGFMAKTEKLLDGHLRPERVGAESCLGRGGGFGEVGRAGILQWRGGSQSPLSHPFEIQVQGHEPREEWQCGPAPGQTGSHHTGPPSSSPCLAPSHPSPPRLAQAYGSQAADPQWSGRSPALKSPSQSLGRV